MPLKAVWPPMPLAVPMPPMPLASPNVDGARPVGSIVLRVGTAGYRGFT